MLIYSYKKSRLKSRPKAAKSRPKEAEERAKSGSKQSKSRLKIAEEHTRRGRICAKWSGKLVSRKRLKEKTKIDAKNYGQSLAS